MIAAISCPDYLIVIIVFHLVVQLLLGEIVICRVVLALPLVSLVLLVKANQVLAHAGLLYLVAEMV